MKTTLGWCVRFRPETQGLCLEVHFARFYFNKVVLGPAPRRAAWRFAVLIRRPVFLDRLPLVDRNHGTNAAHCTKLVPKC